jgi:inosine-uridine nucleoside N-ribohydrolase
LQAAPALADRLTMIYIMGGAVEVPGNLNVPGVGLEANTSAEWNIYVDPYAANVVLQSGAPVTLVPLDATNQAPVTLDFYQRLGAARDTPEAEFAHAVLGQQRDMIAGGGYYFWDPLAAAILADESLATFETRGLSVIEAEGDESGRLVTAADGAPVRFAQGVDQDRFEAQFVEALNASWP